MNMPHGQMKTGSEFLECSLVSKMNTLRSFGVAFRPFEKADWNMPLYYIFKTFIRPFSLQLTLLLIQKNVMSVERVPK